MTLPLVCNFLDLQVRLFYPFTNLLKMVFLSITYPLFNLTKKKKRFITFVTLIALIMSNISYIKL
jgi:hypothetical protein